MAHVEPMDLDSIESDFDNKENAYQHNNALPRMSCSDKGYEELDVSEFNMKLRYPVTPASSPMSKSFTANCLDNRNISSVEDVLINNQNLTRSLNSTMTNSDSILKSPKSLPLQSLSTDQFTDLNRNSSIRRSLDIAKNNVTVTITTPQDLDDNLSLPSTSSSTHTPEATTPTKEISKQDSGSPILRGLKSVLSMFRSSQSPIPPHDEINIEKKDETSSELPIKDTKPQAVLSSTPIRNKNSPLKSGSPLKDSVVFKDDLERELQWKEDSTIIFKEEKVPIHKLFLPTLPIEIKPAHEEKIDNINTTVEYMDISMNESAINESVKHIIKSEANNTIESDSEFQDCETIFTKNEEDVEIKDKTNKANGDCSHDNIDMSIVENENYLNNTNQLQVELNINQTVNNELPIESNIPEIQSDACVKLDSTIKNEVEKTENKNMDERDNLVEVPNDSINNTISLDKQNLECENQCAILNKGNEISGDAKTETVVQNTLLVYDNKHIGDIDCNQDNINMSIVENEYNEEPLNQSKDLLQSNVELNVNETINLQTPIEDNIMQEEKTPERVKLDETINIDTNSKLLQMALPDVIESTENKDMTEIKDEDVLLKESVDKTSEIIFTTEVDANNYKCEQSCHDNTHSILNEITEIRDNTNVALNSLHNLGDLQINMLNNDIPSENSTVQVQISDVENNSDDNTQKVQEISEIQVPKAIEQNISKADLNIHKAIIPTLLDSEGPPKSSNEETAGTEPNLLNITKDISIHYSQDDVLNKTIEGDILLNNIQSEPIIDTSKIESSTSEINQSLNDMEIGLPKYPVVSKSKEMKHVSITNMENNTPIINTDIDNSKPSDIPLPFDNETMPSLTNEIPINNEEDINKANNIDSEINHSYLVEKTTVLSHIEGPSDTELKKNLDPPILQNNDNNSEVLGAPEPHPIEQINIAKVADRNEQEMTNEMNEVGTIEYGNINSESCVLFKDNSENDLKEIKLIETVHNDITIENESISQNDKELTKRTTEESVQNVTCISEVNTINEASKKSTINNCSINQEHQQELIDQIKINSNDLATDMEVDNIIECNEMKAQNPFETKCKIVSTPPSSPVISSKGYNFNFDEMDDPFATKTKIRQSPPPENLINETFKPDATETNKTTVRKSIQNRRKSQPIPRNKHVSKKAFNSTFAGTIESKMEKNEDIASGTDLNNDFPKEVSKQIDCHNITGNVNDLEMTTDAQKLEENKSNNDICTVDDSNLKKDVGNAYCNSNKSISIETNRKNVFNLPEIDDRNFNPFATRSRICVSPTPEISSFEHENTANLDICNGTENKISNDVNVTVNINSSDISNSTASSKHTEDKNDTVKEINTEDEDTIEGPFLEAEDLADLDKDADILPCSEKDDMIGFDDFPTQSNEDNGDNAEIFIDAQAFEFLLNQNTSNVVADSGKESLFLKFDPLFAKRVSSDGILAALNKVPKRVSTPKKKTTHVDSNLLTNVQLSAGPSNKPPPSSDIADDININASKPTMVVNPAVNSIISPRKAATPPKINRQSLTFTSPAMAVIDRLLSLSGNGNCSSLNHDTSIPQVSSEQHQTDLALIQLRELLAEKEIHVQTLRTESKELKERLTIMESQVRSLETESQDRLRKISDLNEKLSEKIKVNKTMSTVVEEYERTIASLVSELEQDKRRNAEERMKLIRDRDEQTAHLASMEVSFSDLHSKYEKSKQIIFSLKANEDTYKKSVKEFEENLIKMQNNYELLKQHATSKLNHANSELEKMNKAHEADVLKLNAMIKRKDLHITSLEETLAQKTKANEELTAICDELINKVG